MSLNYEESRLIFKNKVEIKIKIYCFEKPNLEPRMDSWFFFMCETITKTNFN
jgi:hypothetical protein